MIVLLRVVGLLLTMMGLHIKEVRTGHMIWLISLIPVVSFAVGSELFLDIDNMELNPCGKNLKGSSGSVINYLSVALAHTIVCMTFLVSSLLRRYSSMSKTKEVIIKKNIIYSLDIITATLYVSVTFFNMNIERLSHHVVYAYFAQIPQIKFLFKNICLDETPFSFYYFSIVPFGAIVVGLTCISIASFEMAIYTSRINEISSTEELEESIETVFSDIKGCFIKVVVMLVTSSIATSLYFLLPYEGQNISPVAYFSFAKAMSVFWGIIFSLTITSFFLLPYTAYRTKIIQLKQSLATDSLAAIHNFEVRNKGYTLLTNNARFIISVFMPVFAALIAPLLS